MAEPMVLQSWGWRDGSLLVMGKLLGNAGATVTQASLSSITMSVFDMDDNDDQVGVDTSLTISSTVYDSLQDDEPWDTDNGAGYNFRYTIAGSFFPTGGHRYWIEFEFVPVSGDSIIGVIEHTAAERKRA